MIDIRALAPATPKTLEPGQFLVSLAARDRRALLGARWETSNVLVDLESMTYLHRENCDYPAGYVVSDVRFEVEETTAMLGNDDLSPRREPSGLLEIWGKQMVAQITRLSNARSLAGGGLAFTLETTDGEAELAVPTAELGQVLQFFASALTHFYENEEGGPTNDLFPIPTKGIGWAAGARPGTQLMVVNVGGYGLPFEIPCIDLADMAKRALALSADDQGKPS